MFRILFIITGLSFTANIFAKQMKTKSEPWLRLKEPVLFPKISPQGDHIAFLDGTNKTLQIISTLHKNTSIVSSNKNLCGSFSWSTYGYRLFFKEIEKRKEKISSAIKVFDSQKRTTKTIEILPHEIGPLLFDPFENRIYSIYDKGVHSFHLKFPEIHPPSWKKSINRNGRWVATDEAILWWPYQSKSDYHQLQDEGKPIINFSLSPNGTTLIWQSHDNQIFFSKNGEQPRKLGLGKDPSWHPHKQMFIYSAPRYLGNKIVQWDLKAANDKLETTWITQTPGQNERWPMYHPNHQHIIYTLERTTDLYLLNYSGMSLQSPSLYKKF